MLRHAIEVHTAYLIFGLLRQAMEVLRLVSKVLSSSVAYCLPHLWFAKASYGGAALSV